VHLLAGRQRGQVQLEGQLIGGELIQWLGAAVAGGVLGHASRGGRRLRLRYLGTARNNAWLKHRTAALNLRNLIGRGRYNGTWMLA
jgi:hypothetical protein